MARPIILAVDDEPQVLNAIERDLRQHYRKEYRILKAGSGAEALDAVTQLKRRNDMVALFLSDQRMPEMSGTDFLGEARKHYPEARKVLLTAYADTQAAIQSINTIGLDHYLMKPWDPPETNLYPVIDDLLSDWQANVAIPYDGIRVAGTLWSAPSHNVKDFLARNRIPYQWLDIEKDAQAKELVEASSDGQFKLPVVFFPDGTTLTAPDNRQLAERVDLKTQASEPFYDMIIVGGRTGRAWRGGVRGIGGAARHPDRARGDRWSGGYQRPHRKLPWVPSRPQRRRSRQARHRTGGAFRRRDTDDPGGDTGTPGGPLPGRDPGRRLGAEVPRPGYRDRGLRQQAPNTGR